MNAGRLCLMTAFLDPSKKKTHLLELPGVKKSKVGGWGGRRTILLGPYGGPVWMRMQHRRGGDVMFACTGCAEVSRILFCY